MSSSINQCACGTGQIFQNCCGKYHSGLEIPPTAELLMRSRYTAYVNCNANYLIDTLHPEKQTATLIDELKASFKGVIWTGLQINEITDGGINDDTGCVGFSAFYETAEGKFRMDENSFFVKISGKWYYKEAV